MGGGQGVAYGNLNGDYIGDCCECTSPSVGVASRGARACRSRTTRHDPNPNLPSHLHLTGGAERWGFDDDDEYDEIVGHRWLCPRCERYAARQEAKAATKAAKEAARAAKAEAKAEAKAATLAAKLAGRAAKAAAKASAKALKATKKKPAAAAAAAATAAKGPKGAKSAR
jgi:hypothetical protein